MSSPPTSQFLPLRLHPGADLRRALADAALKEGAGAAFVVAGIGSLREAMVRFAAADAETAIAGPLEILTLSGSLGEAGAHLHIAVSDAQGRVYGGHLGYGSTVRTTAEVVLAVLTGWSLGREPDPQTGFDELVVSRHPGAG